MFIEFHGPWVGVRSSVPLKMGPAAEFATSPGANGEELAISL